MFLRDKNLNVGEISFDNERLKQSNLNSSESCVDLNEFEAFVWQLFEILRLSI